MRISGLAAGELRYIGLSPVDILMTVGDVFQLKSIITAVFFARCCQDYTFWRSKRP